mmetsp:Transcript_19293/g.39280  ORF Transcript_19293/g.39280 Transcript_19293/m.39280 type:complete len:468 (-) Transcript_19293:931-2334(-)
MAKKIENPWEIDFIDKMSVFSDINNSSKFKSTNVTSTFNLASFSIHTGVRIYSERIDALHDFITGFLRGLLVGEKKRLKSNLREINLSDKELKKEKSKISLSFSRFSNSKKNFIDSLKTTNFYFSVKFFPEKNFLLGFRMKETNFMKYKKSFKKTDLLISIETLQNMDLYLIFLLHFFLFDKQKNFQIKNFKSILIKKTFSSSAFSNSNRKIFGEKFPNFKIPFKEKNLVSFQTFTGQNKINSGEFFKKRKEKRPIYFPKNKDFFLFFLNYRESKNVNKKSFSRRVPVSKKIDTAEIDHWVLKKKFYKESDTFQGKLCQTNFLIRGERWKNSAKKTNEIIDKNLIKVSENLNQKKDKKRQKKSFSKFKKFDPIFYQLSGFNFLRNNQYITLKSCLKSCMFSLKTFSMHLFQQKGFWILFEKNFSKFVLFFLQVASEKNLYFIGEINLTYFFYITHARVYSSNGRVSA